jgi:hypothetical protein
MGQRSSLLHHAAAAEVDAPTVDPLDQRGGPASAAIHAVKRLVKPPQIAALACPACAKLTVLTSRVKLMPLINKIFKSE